MVKGKWWEIIGLKVPDNVLSVGPLNIKLFAQTIKLGPLILKILPTCLVVLLEVELFGI